MQRLDRFAPPLASGQWQAWIESFLYRPSGTLVANTDQKYTINTTINKGFSSGPINLSTF